MGKYTFGLAALCIQCLFATEPYAIESQKTQRFLELYDRKLAEVGLGTRPGVYNESPLGLNVQASVSHWLIGSFTPKPSHGGALLLRDPFGHNGILEGLWTTQHFSGYRWFWYGEMVSFQSPPVGGYYDLSAVTLPTNANMSLSNHVLSLNWQNPTATDYGTRVSYRVSPYHSSMHKVQDGRIVYDGFGQEVQVISRPAPGNWIQLGFFGMKELGSYRIDSGAGVQALPWSQGAQQYASLHASKSGDGSELRVLLETANARIQSLNKPVYKVRPQGASIPTDPGGNEHPWPILDQVYTLHATHLLAQSQEGWVQDQSRLFEVDPDTGTTREVDDARILSAYPNQVTVRLESTWLGREEPCKRLHLYLQQGPGTGYESNRYELKLVHANPWLARLCQE